MADRPIRVRRPASATIGLALGLVVAVVLLVLQNVEYWLPAWQPTTGRPAPVSIRLPAYSVYRMHLGQPADLIRRQVLIGRGEVLEPNEEARLVAAHYTARARGAIGWPLGLFCASLAAALLLAAALRRSTGFARLSRAQVGVFGLLLLLLVGAKAYLLYTGLPPYYYPLPAVVLAAAYVFDRNVAFAVNLFASAMMASLVGFDPTVFVVFLATGFAGTLFVKSRKKRRVVIQAGSLSGWLAALALLVVMLVYQGTIHVPDLLNPDYSGVLAALVGGVFSGLLGWALVGPLGWLAGKVSRGRLLDLQDLDHPVLKMLRERAPGTWEHSRAMANLAEAAAAAIGADSLLVRVGAYVHDAGKALAPEYYIENQSALEIPNPHDELAPDVSAQCIFDHVVEGVKLLRKHRMPETVVEFAYTHHGTSLLEYFWIKNMEAGNPEGFKEGDFSYPGAAPTSRETAIVMLVDAIEAASRTIKPPEKSRFEALVQRLVFSKLSQGQLDGCGIGLEDLRVVNSTIVDTLVNAYHARIEYPWQRRDDTSPTGTGPQASISRTGPHPSTAGHGGTGPHAVVTRTGPQALANGSGTGPPPAEPPPSAALRAPPPSGLEAGAGAPANEAGDEPPAPHVAAEPRTLRPPELAGPEPAVLRPKTPRPSDPGEEPPRRRKRTATDPGLGAPVRRVAAGGNGALPVDAAPRPVPPFPPAADAPEEAEISGEPGDEASRKVVAQRS